MSENDMKELQPGKGAPALGAAPQSAELNAGGQASHGENTGLPFLGSGSEAGKAALAKFEAAGRVDESNQEMGGGGDATDAWVVQKGGYDKILHQIQQNGWADNMVWKLDDGTKLSVAEVRRRAAAAASPPPLEPQPAPHTAESQPTFPLSAEALVRLAGLEAAGTPLEEALRQMGQEGLAPLGELGSGMALDYYKRMKEEAVKIYEKVPEGKRHDWIERQAIAILNAHQPQEASYEHILLSLVGSRFSTNKDRALVDSLTSIPQSYGAYESLTGPEGLEQATGRIPNDEHIGAFVEMGRTWKVKVKRANGQEVELTGRVNIGEAMDWMQEDWGLKVCTEDSIMRDKNEGLFIKFLFRKALKDQRGNQVLLDDEDFQVLSAEDVEMGDKLGEKELKRFIGSHGWLVKGAYMMHEVMTTLFDIDPTLRSLNVDGLKSTQAQPEYHDGYNIGVTEGRFYRETWHDNFVNNKADKLLPFISKVAGLSDEDKELIRGKVSVFSTPVEKQMHDWEYLTGKIRYEEWTRVREEYIQWLVKDLGFKSWPEMQRVVSPLRMRDFAEKELWLWTPGEKARIAERDFRPALKHMGVKFDESDPATYTGYQGLRRCVMAASYESYTWELLKKKDFPKYAGKYMERAGKMADGESGCFQALGISPRGMGEKEFLESRRNKMKEKFGEAMGNVTSYQSGNGQFLAGVNLLVGLVRSGCVNRQMRPMAFTRDGVECSTVKLDVTNDIRARVERAKEGGLRVLDNKYVINGNNQAVRKYSPDMKTNYCPNLVQYGLPPLDWETVLELINIVPNASEFQKQAVKQYLLSLINLEENQVALYHMLREESAQKLEEHKRLNQYMAEGKKK